MVIYIIMVYLIVGLLSLAVFEITTGGRIRRKLAGSVGESQARIVQSGNYVGVKTTTVLLFGAMWLFWPAVFIGVAQSKLQERRNIRKVK